MLQIFSVFTKRKPYQYMEDKLSRSKQYSKTQAKKIEEKNKRLRHVLESSHRVRTEEDEPPFKRGKG